MNANRPFPPVTFIGSGYVTIRNDGQLQTQNAAGVADFKQGLKISFSVNDRGFYHYYHALETLFILYACQQEFGERLSVAKMFFASPEWNNPKQNNIQSKMVHTLFPDIEVIDNAQAYPIKVENLFRFDRGHQRHKFGIVFEPWMDLLRHHTSAIRKKVKMACGASPIQSKYVQQRIVYVTRNPPRCLVPAQEALLLYKLKTVAEVIVADFSGISWEEQVRLCAACNIIIGVHGNGLSNLLWLTENATVIEIFPASARNYCYQFMSEICDFQYYGCDGKFVMRNGDRRDHPTPPAAVRKGVENLDIATILEIVTATTKSESSRI